MATQLAHDFLEAINIVAESGISRHKYDRTIEAKVVASNRKAESIYKVEYQTTQFDAFAQDGGTYYDGDIVYVMIPEDDFSKQKFIVARKVIDEENNSKPIHFKLPFDGYVPLLTFEGEAANNSWHANKPDEGKDGINADAVVAKINELSEAWQERLIQSQQLIAQWKFIHENIYGFLSEKVAIHEGNETTLPEGYYENLKTLILDQYNLTTVSEDYNFETIWNTYNVAHWPSDLTYEFALSSVERDDLNAANTAQLRVLSTNEDIALSAFSALQSTELNATIIEAGGQSGDLAWSWVAPSVEGVLQPQQVINDNLGVSVDVKTLLDFYKPRTGKYGLRFLVVGTAKPAEEQSAHSIVETFYFTNDDMYGNTYGYYEYYTQQKLFDVSSLVDISAIYAYFWQDFDFKDQFGQEVPYKYSSDNTTIISTEAPIADQIMDANIFYNAINVYLGTTVENVSRDKVYLYTYDDLYYSINENLELVGPANRNMRMAWVHITEDGPVLVDHWEATGENDVKSMEYWQAQTYWFHFEQGCAQDTSNFPERQAGINWALMPECNNLLLCSIIPSGDVPKEQYKAMVVYNNNYSVDTTMTFTNSDTTAGAVIELKNEVIFKLMREERVENPDTGVITSTVVEDRTLPMLNIYDQHGEVIKENGISLADLWYYVQVWVRNNDNGTYAPLLYNEGDDLANVIWHEPINTLIASGLQSITDAEFAANVLLAPNWGESVSEDYKQQLRNITRKFKVSKQFNYNQLENTISAFVQQGERGYRPSVTLYFDKNSTMGSQYTLSIGTVVDNTDTSILIKNVPFTLTVYAKDKDGAIMDLNKCRVSWKLLSPTTVIKEDGTDGWDIIDNTSISGKVINDNPPIFEVSVTGLDNYTLKYTRGFRMVSDAETASLIISCPDRVEFKADGRVPISDTNNFTVAAIDDVVAKSLFPEWSLVQYKKTGNSWVELAEAEYFKLETGLSPSFSFTSYDNLMLYAPYFTYDKEEGTIDDKGNIIEDGGYVEAWLDYVSQNVAAFNPDAAYPNLDHEILTELPEDEIEASDYKPFTYKQLTRAADQYRQAAENLIADITGETGNTDLSSIEYENTIGTSGESDWVLELYHTRLGKLQSIVLKQTESYTKYRMSVKDMYDNQFLWKEKLATNYYTYLGFGNLTTTLVDGYKQNTGEKIEYELKGYVRQAVPFTKNVYSSALINSWDGKYYFDDADGKGHLFAQLISAGTKDNYNNTYTGVLMGNWAEEADSTLAIPGIYGIYKGTETFGFLSDGTGFIGGVDRGRIEFNGAHSMISNAFKTMYMNLDPAIYDENGSITDVESYSPYFLYAEVKKSVPSTLAVSNDDWTTSVDFADNIKEYFVVNPSRGVMTTGGIFAKYGKIGNWTISENGLVQERVGALGVDNKHDRYMYLGSDSLTEIIETAYETAYADIKGNTSLSEEEKEAALKDLYEQTIQNLADDTDKYAIWCGYRKNEPALFSVNWRGAMQAREGLIGYNSPWLITDDGLTSTNNFGTIFLGRPDAPYDMSKWVTFGDNVLEYVKSTNHIIYHNGSLNEPNIYSLKNESNSRIEDEALKAQYPEMNKAGEILYSYDETSKLLDLLEEDGNPVLNPETTITLYTKGEQTGETNLDTYSLVWLNTEAEFNSMHEIYDVIGKYLYPSNEWHGFGLYYRYSHEYAVGQTTVIQEYKYQPRMAEQYPPNPYVGKKVFDTYGAFAIQAGNLNNDRAVHFGVRTDGTLFSDRGFIGGLRIENNRLVCYQNDVGITETDIVQTYIDENDTTRFLGYADDNFTIPVYGKRKRLDERKTTTTVPVELLVLDANKAQIKLNNNHLILDGKSGFIQMDNFKLSPLESSIPVYKDSANSTETIRIKGQDYTYTTIGTTGATPKGSNKNNFSVSYNLNNNLVASCNFYVNGAHQFIIEPKKAEDSANSERVVNGILGTETRRWDVYANKVWVVEGATTSEVASQKWVLETLYSILGATASS